MEQRTKMEHSLPGDALEEVQEQEAAKEAIGASQQDHARLGRQLPGRGGRSRRLLVGLREEALQVQVSRLDNLAVAAMNALESDTSATVATAAKMIRIHVKVIALHGQGTNRTEGTYQACTQQGTLSACRASNLTL